MLDYASLFWLKDDFCKAFEEWWKKTLLTGVGGKKRRVRATRLHLSEIITIMLAYHDSGYRCFKDYYQFIFH